MLAIGTEPSGLHCSYRWCINNRNRLHDLLLVGLRAGSVKVADNRGHACLVAHGSRQMDGLLGVVLREAARFQSVPGLHQVVQQRGVRRVGTVARTYDLTFPR